MDVLVNVDSFRISGNPVEDDLMDEMDRADEMLSWGHSGEWREWGDEDEMDIDD